MRAFKTRILTGLLAVLTASLLNACGGAIGDLSTSANAINYTGLTTQATLTSDNDDAFGLAMLEGGAEGGASIKGIQLATSTSNDSPQSTAKNQLSAMETMVQQIIANTHQGQDSTGAIANLQAQVVATGTCGGTIDISATQSGGSIVYNNYCTSLTVGSTTIKTTINGTVNYSLTGDIQSGTYDFTYSYSAMTVTIDDGTTTTSHYFSGTITYSVNNWSLTVTYSTSFQRDGKIYKLEDPTVSTGSTFITLSGTLYHPDYGYADITTDSTFSKTSSGQYCGGILRITAKDSGGNTVFSTMTINADCTAYTISFNGGATETVTW